MTTELLDKLTDEIAEQVIAKAGPKLLAYLDERRITPAEDPLLTVKESAKRLGVSTGTVRKIVALGELKRARGITDIMIRQSVVDAYGKDDPKKGGKA